MKRSLFFAVLIASFAAVAAAQVTLPPVSQRQSVTQGVGDTTITIVYHRPNVNGRKIWDGLVPYSQVWRAGANQATLFEFSKDVTINGKPLPAGKYSFHVIPSAGEWTLIFNKDAGQWGSFAYNEKDDAVRVTATPAKTSFHESLTYSFVDPKPDSVTVQLAWENLAVPMTIGIGDVHGRLLTQIREGIASKTGAEQVPFLNQFGSYVATFKQKEHYVEGLKHIDASIGVRETYSNLSIRARILGEQGKYSEAVATAEKAIALGRASTPPTNPNIIATLETLVTEWKAKI